MFQIISNDDNETELNFFLNFNETLMVFDHKSFNRLKIFDSPT